MAWNTRKKTVVGGAVALLILAYGLAEAALHFDKLEWLPEQYAAEIAIGIIGPGNGYAWKSGDPVLDAPTCATSYKAGDSYFRCVALDRRMAKSGCAWWRFERCLNFEAHDYLLTRADLLGPILDAIRRPCRYLPDMTKPDVRETVAPKDRHFFETYWEEAGCTGNRSRGKEKIVVNFRDKADAVVARYVIY